MKKKEKKKKVRKHLLRSFIRSMEPKQKRAVVLFLVLAIVCLVGGLLAGTGTESEAIKEVMKDGVLHETGKINFFGMMEVNPALYSAMIVNACFWIFGALVRIFVVPRFTIVPGRFQSLLELWVGFFDNLAKTNSPHRHKFLSVYIFGAGSYIFIGTLFELIGLQWINTEGGSITLPAPLSDINGAIALGVLSYCVILSGGIAGNKLKGVGQTLKDFSLPVSMSFRMFGALLSGLLVTELVYHYLQLSILLPVLVALLFTVLHALVQAYVLVMLTSMFYGEVSERHPKKEKKPKKFKIKRNQANA